MIKRRKKKETRFGLFCWRKHLGVVFVIEFSHQAVLIHAGRESEKRSAGHSKI
jgi:hypothetical protein